MTESEHWSDYALYDENGEVVIAHLCRQKNDLWDALVVSKTQMPLVFWGLGVFEELEGSVREGDRVKMVVASTPPGTQPGGFTVLSADTWDSPLGTLLDLVTADGYTVIDAKGSPEGEPETIESLIARVGETSGGANTVREMPSADGGTSEVLIDWDGRPIMFWTYGPPKSVDRKLMIITVFRNRFVTVGVDASLRPLLSSEAMAQYYEDHEL